MPAPVHALDAENEFLFLQRGHIIRPPDKGNFRGVNFPENRQFRWWRPVFDYLDSITFGHNELILAFLFQNLFQYIFRHFPRLARPWVYARGEPVYGRGFGFFFFFYFLPL